MVKLTGGTKLAGYLNDLSKKVSQRTYIEVGFLEGATYPDGTPVPLVAAVQEFGSPTNNIPPRPFFRNMISKESDDWGPLIAARLDQTDYDSEAALGLVGNDIAGQLKQSIIDTNSPVLKPATIAAKGFDKPLIDTGHLLNSIDFLVK